MGYIQNAFEDKREDLERKRLEAENNFRKTEALNFHREIQIANEAARKEKEGFTGGVNQPMNHVKEQFNSFDVDSIFNANGQNQRGR